MRFIDEYHILYEESKIWKKNNWMGIPAWKLPMDMMVIQELIVKQRPQFIIETGSAYGGSAAFYASVCELLGEGQVITIDIEDRMMWEELEKYSWKDRIEFFGGSSTNPLVVEKVKSFVGEKSNCMVILDSWHTKEHVNNEMKIYSNLVPVDGYMIVEDSHANGNPVPWKYNDEGPMGAINEWISNNNEWKIDWGCEKHLLTFNPSGYLRRIA